MQRKSFWIQFNVCQQGIVRVIGQNVILVVQKLNLRKGSEQSPRMIFDEAFQKMEQQPNEQPENPNIDQSNNQPPEFQQPDLNNQPVIPEMIFIPPPISDCSKYLDQLQNEFLQNITKNQSSLDFLTIFGQRRPIHLLKNQLPEPIFVDQNVKIKLKKSVRNIYEKMIENLKYCAGQMPLNYSNPLPKITQKTHQFMRVCQQLQVGQTKAVIWNLIKEETNTMNKKSQQIEEFVEGMVNHCKNQQLKNF